MKRLAKSLLAGLLFCTTLPASSSTTTPAGRASSRRGQKWNSGSAKQRERKSMALEFEKQDRESGKAFAAFAVYLSMGSERSLAQVGKNLGKSEGLIERWSKRYDWGGRVQAHGAHFAMIEREVRARSSEDGGHTLEHRFSLSEAARGTETKADGPRRRLGAPES